MTQLPREKSQSIFSKTQVVLDHNPGVRNWENSPLQETKTGRSTSPISRQEIESLSLEDYDAHLKSREAVLAGASTKLHSDLKEYLTLVQENPNIDFPKNYHHVVSLMTKRDVDGVSGFSTDWSRVLLNHGLHQHYAPKSGTKKGQTKKGGAKSNSNKSPMEEPEEPGFLGSS